jgi:DNA-directed RNA polymerase specialized sigma24 family protein
LAEIAAVLAAPISTVKSRLYRGLEELRALLAGEAA